MSETEERRRLVELGDATGLWVLVASVVGYGVISWGPVCAPSSQEAEPPGAGAAAVCGGELPFTPILLTFGLAGFAAFAALLLLWEPTRRHTRRLCLAVALVPVLAFVVLVGISLVP